MDKQITKYNKIEDPTVLYEDSDFYALFKPAGWCVYVGNNIWEQNVHNPDNFNKKLLQNWTHKNLNYPLNDNLEYGYGIANRLDVETSGIVFVAKNLKAYQYLRSEINDHVRTHKIYLTLVHGYVFPKSGKIDIGINCHKIKQHRICFTDIKSPKAITFYKVIEYYTDSEGNPYSFLMIRIITGRTHQIRVHMRSKYHPVVTDPQYAISPRAFHQNTNIVPRLFLHAAYYSFIDQNDKKIEIKSPLPHDLSMSLKKLTKIKLN